MKTRTEQIKNGEMKMTPVVVKATRYYYSVNGELLLVQCTRCGGNFKKEELAKQSRSPVGVRALCKECDRKKSEAYNRTEHGKAKRTEYNQRLRNYAAERIANGEPCVRCGKPFTDGEAFHADHIPSVWEMKKQGLSKEEIDVPEHIFPAHASCNISAGSRLREDERQRRLAARPKFRR